MAKEKNTLDPLTETLLNIFKESFTAMLMSATYNGGPEAAYVCANTAVESMIAQRDSIKEAWIAQRIETPAESVSSTP